MFIKNFSDFLEQVSNKPYPDAENPLIVDPFRIETPVPLKTYVQRLSDLGGLEEQAFKRICITTQIYIDKIAPSSKILLSPDTIHLIFGTAFAISQKMIFDEPWDNSFCSKLLGIPLKRLNHIELAFFKALQWDASIGQTTYKKYVTAWNELFPEDEQIAPEEPVHTLVVNTSREGQIQLRMFSLLEDHLNPNKAPPPEKKASGSIEKCSPSCILL
ncbi:MAG: hypothetical protein COT85_06425 [Chlamydiae bacterium CG10_big_fil_rev_8_21_14_0_10_42_34]|nr:MAG: hypothetical protein COT85_06425 [Chlamydiae bacterium CG10_big_fil_rev_8_21_14_0_10_42_34]